MASDWLIQRNMNMTYENVMTLLLHPELSAGKGNPSAAPNTLQDWGFLTPNKKLTELGDALVKNEIAWSEAVLVALSKRGTNDAGTSIKPFVVFCKVLSRMYSKDATHAYLSPRAFGRFLYLKNYDEITDDFCDHVNDASNPEVGLYRDIWYNALTETGLFMRRPDKSKGAIGLVETDATIAFVKYVAEHGEKLTTCPIKATENEQYFSYMGCIETGIVEILHDAPVELINATFPHYFSLLNRGAAKNSELVGQEKIDDVSAFVSQVIADSQATGLKYASQLVSRLIAGILAKQFVVLTGLSGSGKTKLAQCFTKWISNFCGNGNSLILGEEFKGGAYVVQACDELDYKIYVKEVGKLRTVSKNAVNQWLRYFKEHPEQQNVDPKIPRKEIQQIDAVDDNYMHGSDAILSHIAREVLAKRNPFAGKQSFVALVPVGADWTNSEHLLGYPNALELGKYVMPETGVLKLMLDARDNPNLPFFLILDEMNLSHVERYFADFLSAMESGEDIKLHGSKGDLEGSDGTKVPPTIKFPKNLFVIGTMNVDETTYMFSPKVLDRAQVIEFRVGKDEMAEFLANPTTPNLEAIAGKGAKYAEAFLRLKANPPPLDENGSANKDAITAALTKFFEPLAGLGAEFGYRTASEVIRFCRYYLATGADITDAIDAAIVQKLLPKLHGSQQRLGPVLKKLKELSEKSINVMEDGEQKTKRVPLYKLTWEKLDRMQVRLRANGFTSFAEA